MYLRFLITLISTVSIVQISAGQFSLSKIKIEISGGASFTSRRTFKAAAQALVAPDLLTFAPPAKSPMGSAAPTMRFSVQYAINPHHFITTSFQRGASTLLFAPILINSFDSAFYHIAFYESTEDLKIRFPFSQFTVGYLFNFAETPRLNLLLGTEVGIRKYAKQDERVYSWYGSSIQAPSQTILTSQLVIPALSDRFIFGCTLRASMQYQILPRLHFVFNCRYQVFQGPIQAGTGKNELSNNQFNLWLFPRSFDLESGLSFSLN